MQRSAAFSRETFLGSRSLYWVRWWLVFCLAFGFFAPSLSHALVNPDVQDGQRIAVCTASGIKYIHWPSTETTPVAGSSHECLICALSGDTPFGTTAQPNDWHIAPEQVLASKGMSQIGRAHV